VAWTSVQLIAWIGRTEARAANANMFELLEVASSADNDAITAAFHRVASGAHPDLHRRGLSPADAERLVRAYGKVSAAYHALRDPQARMRYRKDLADRGRITAPPPVIGAAEVVQGQRPATAAQALAARTGGATISGFGVAPAIARTLTPTAPPLGGRAPTVPPLGGRAPTTPPTMARTTTPPTMARTTTPPTMARTTTPPTVARTTTPPARPRTSSPSPASATAAASPITRGRTPTGPRAVTRAPTAPGDTRSPLITPTRAGTGSEPPATTRPPIAATNRPRGDSRPPTAGIGARAQVYYRKAQACLTQGDLGGGLFNLRLAAAADPRSSAIRVALAEVEAAMGKK